MAVTTAGRSLVFRRWSSSFSISAPRLVIGMVLMLINSESQKNQPLQSGRARSAHPPDGGCRCFDTDAVV
eukprot:9672-Eustigmatos_ZCMA.PRE.1